MKSMLYHGSITPGITELQVRFQLHGSNQKVVYLTNSIPYALFYIWDSKHNGCSTKYVTGGFRDGIAFYEEQFPDQLKTFYQGVSGYLYHIPFTADVQPVENRDGLFFQPNSAAIANVEFVPDVHAALLKYEANGQLRVLRYDDQTDERKAELTDRIATFILHSNFFANDQEQQAFMEKHFSKAWRKANEYSS